MGRGSPSPSLERDPSPGDDLPPLNPSGDTHPPTPLLQSIYQILPVSPHFSLPELQEFVSVVLQGLQPSLDLFLRGRKRKISFLWSLGQLQKLGRGLECRVLFLLPVQENIPALIAHVPDDLGIGRYPLSPGAGQRLESRSREEDEDPDPSRLGGEQREQRPRSVSCPLETR